MLNLEGEFGGGPFGPNAWRIKPSLSLEGEFGGGLGGGGGHFGPRI